MAAAIHQEVSIGASPERIYKAFVDSAQFSALTGGAPAEISTENGGKFSCFGGAISGINVELVPGKRIVQAWRVGNWPEGLYSLVRFELEPEGTGTKLVFDHSGFPEAEAEHLAAGWHERYWEPLKKFLA